MKKTITRLENIPAFGELLNDEGLRFVSGGARVRTSFIKHTTYQTSVNGVADQGTEDLPMLD